MISWTQQQHKLSTLFKFPEVKSIVFKAKSFFHRVFGFSVVITKPTWWIRNDCTIGHVFNENRSLEIMQIVDVISIVIVFVVDDSEECAASSVSLLVNVMPDDLKRIFN